MAKSEWPRKRNKTFKYLWYCLKKNKKNYGKKTKSITEKEKQKCKAHFKGETGISIIKLRRDIIEYCKLPEAIELRKKLGYNHEDIMKNYAKKMQQIKRITKRLIKLPKNLKK